MTQQKLKCNQFFIGLKDGIPIGLGYLSVSFTFGMMAVSSGLSIWLALFISMTNLTSAGQFAGLTLITAGATCFEMAITQLVINLRYSLMSISLSQKTDESVTLLDRFCISFFNTDEIFAVAMSKRGDVGKHYLYGLACIPYLGWAFGTLLGAAASGFLPDMVRSALGIAIYGMFLAIIIPPAKKKRPICVVLLISVLLSCLLNWAPIFQWISSGFAMIFCAIASAAIGAYFFPVQEAES